MFRPEYLQAIYDRRLHLQRGYASLHEFLVQELGYSDGAAHRRISAMRLVQEVPEAKASLAEGSLSLTTASQVQRFFQSEKKQQRNYSQEAKKELLTRVAGSSRLQCERKLAKISPTYNAKEKMLMIPEDEELVGLIEEYRKLALLAEGSSQKVIKSALRRAIAQMRTTQKQREKRDQKSIAEREEIKTTSPAKLHSRYVPASVKRTVWQRNQGRCSYIDFKTKKRCEAKHRLELDHIVPFALDGETTANNLRLLCCAHNQMLVQQTYG